jgi:hypothetical protein
MDYSTDEIILMAIEWIKKGASEEEVQRKLSLSKDDMDLVDFIINEF